MTNIKQLQTENETPYLLSIVTVVYNDLQGLRRTYQSIVSQPPFNYQWIIIDGASTDGTVEFLYTLDNPHFDWISEDDSGIYDAMNKGAVRSQGKYLLFLNAGDEILPSALAILQDDLINNSLPSINTYATIVSSPDHSEAKYLSNPNNLGSYMSVYHSSTIIPKSFFTELGGYNLAYKLASDYDLLLRAHLRKFPYQAFDAVFSRYYRGGASDKLLIRSRLEAIFALWANNSPSKLNGTFMMVRNLMYTMYPPIHYLPSRVYRFFQLAKACHVSKSRRRNS